MQGIVLGVNKMLDNYTSNIKNIISAVCFVGFKVILIILVIFLIFSLIMLATGCLIKSQKIKSKFLNMVICLLVVTCLILVLPCVFVLFKK